MHPLDTPEGALVYADWLLAHGNLHGELIIVQRARQIPGHSVAAQRALRLREEELLAKHGPEIAGPLGRGSRLCWRGGFVRELAVSVSAPDVADLPELFARPAFAFLERLSLDISLAYTDDSHAQQTLAALPRLPHLRALAISVRHRDALDLTSLPPQLEHLSVDANLANVLFGPLPQLRWLRLQSQGCEGLTPSSMPKLRRVQTSADELFGDWRGLELHLGFPEPTVDDLGELEPSRAVVMTEEPEGWAETSGAPWLAVRTEAQAEERALLALEASDDEVRQGLARLQQLPLTGAITCASGCLQIGSRRLTVLELRSNEAQPALLRSLAAELVSRLGRGVVEAAVSASNALGLFRAHERIGNNATSGLIERTGHGATAGDGFRRAVHRVLGYDPGLDALSEVFVELDAALPVAVHGELPASVVQLPCCTPIEPTTAHQLDEDGCDDDDDDEEDDDEGDGGGYIDLGEAQEDEALVEVVALFEHLGEDEAAEEEPESDFDEPHRDLVNLDLEELLTQGPVDADAEDGEEASATPTEDDPSALMAPAVCEVCRREQAAEACQRCGAEVCETCVALEVPITCSECRAGPVVEPALVVTPRPSAGGQRH